MEWLVAGWEIVLFGMGLVTLGLMSQKQMAQRVRSKVCVREYGEDGAKATRDKLNA